MSDSYMSAMIGLTGAVIGGLTSFATSWLTQRAQMHEKMRAAEHGRREKLHVEFIKEASRLFGDALSHEREEIADLVPLYALVARIRLVASSEVLSSAEKVMEAIIATYLAPNRTLHELKLFAHEGGFNPLLAFSAACRTELERLAPSRL
jgi:hypothetical protein